MKKIFAVLMVVCLVFGMVGCQQNDVSASQEQTSAVSNNTIIPKLKGEETEPETKSETASETESETATAPQNTDINIETLAAGEERDYKIEDILKNDLEIDGIPISIPCTLNELLETLGDDYSVDSEDELKSIFSGITNVRSEKFEGEYFGVSLNYKEEGTCGRIQTIADPSELDYDSANVIGYFAGLYKGVSSLSGFSKGDKIENFFEKYGKPSEIDSSGNFIYYTFKDSTGFFQIAVRNDSDTIWKFMNIELNTEYIYDEN